MQTPRYEYSRSKIEERLTEFKSLQAPFGITVRYALKANPHAEIVKMMNEAGVHFDASSSYEAQELLEQGVEGSHISLSSQQSPHNLEHLLQKGVLFVATSFKQLELFLHTHGRPDTVAIRINPSMGYGHNNRTTTGGVNASFGIWHEYSEKIKEVAHVGGVVIDRMHIHIGSGADPAVWGGVMESALIHVEQFADVTTLDIGGGFKVHRYGKEAETNLKDVLDVFSEKVNAFKAKTGREIHLEIEPGTYAIAHVGTLIAQVEDIVDTGTQGYTFMRLNTGMNDFLRTSLYGAQHDIEVVNESRVQKEYVVVGHNCESGDLFTSVHGNSEELETRLLNEASIGDEVRIRDVGAYCASMRAKGYNSFPDASEILVDES